MISLSHAIRDELRLLRRQGVALGALLGLILLLVAAALNGAALTAQRADATARIVADAQLLASALAEQAARGAPTATSPGMVGYSLLSQPAVLTPAALAPLAIGQADLLPDFYAVTARGSHQFMTAAVLDNPLRLALGSFDVSFVLIWLVPLVIIALSFDLISGDRERGILTIALSQGVRLGRFVLTKLAVRMLVLVLPLCLALLIAAGIAGVPLASGEGAVGMLLWLLGFVLYAAVWFALALFINAVPRSSDRNATLLAGAWLLFVVVLPSLTNLAATTVFPAPSRVTLTTELREATEAADRAAAVARAVYFFDHPDMQDGDMDQTAYYQSVAESEQQIGAAMAPLLVAFDAQAAAQRRVVAAMQYLSPGTTTYQLLTGLAGSDGRRHVAFRQEAQRFQGGWSEFFSEPLAVGGTLTAEDYRQLPRFSFAGSRPSRLLGEALLPLFALAAMVGLLGFAALRRLKEYSVV